MVVQSHSKSALRLCDLAMFWEEAPHLKPSAETRQRRWKKLKEDQRRQWPNLGTKRIFRCFQPWLSHDGWDAKESSQTWPPLWSQRWCWSVRKGPSESINNDVTSRSSRSSRYFTSFNMFQSTQAHNSSHFWRILFNVRATLTEACCWECWDAGQKDLGNKSEHFKPAFMGWRLPYCADPNATVR